MFSPAQQKYYRPLLKHAWLAHCARSGLAPNQQGAYQQWYRALLMDTLGIYTTKQANKGRDYDVLMGRIEELINDGADYWQLRAAVGDEVRIRHIITRAMATADIDERYVNGICANMGFRPEWQDLPAKQMWRVWIAIDRHIKRKAVVYETRQSVPDSGIS